jgi:hypothetical protein
MVLGVKWLGELRLAQLHFRVEIDSAESYLDSVACLPDSPCTGLLLLWALDN